MDMDIDMPIFKIERGDPPPAYPHSHPHQKMNIKGQQGQSHGHGGTGTGTGSSPASASSSSSSNNVTVLQPFKDHPYEDKDGYRNLPDWHLDLIMQKLRQRIKVSSTLVDTSKIVRSAILERRSIIDTPEKTSLQKCLDNLQGSIRVNSLHSMVEKLEMVSRQQGLKFTPGSSGNEWFISSDMFYLELLMDSSGAVQDVKIQHEGKAEQHACPEIVDSLKRNDFPDFTSHLEGLVSIYAITADKKTKSKVFIALQSLENDLSVIGTTYSHYTDGETVVMKSLLGLIEPRKGGHPVRLTYYVSPYEFLDVDSKSLLPPDVNTIIEKKLGYSATVSVQPYAPQRLQMSTTVTIQRSPDGKGHPRYGPLNATNSTALPACFTVNLKNPIPMCKDLLESIQKITGIHTFDFTTSEPILKLITKYASRGKLECSERKGLFVELPDQTHRYFMTETLHLQGILVTTVSFTLASQLPQVIQLLRQQLSFNILVASCVRVDSKAARDSIVFEVSALSHQNLTVSFQHPLESSLVTLEFDLRDVAHPQCRLHAVAKGSDIIPTLEEYACKVVHKTMSIPVTLRAVIRRWQGMIIKSEPSNPEFNLRVGSGFNPANSNIHRDLTPSSCGADSERVSQHNQQQNPLNQQIPGMVMGLNTPSTTNNNNNNNNKQPNSGSGSVRGIPTPSTSSSYTITPVVNNNRTNPTPPPPIDQLLTPSFMNPIFSSMGLGNAAAALATLQNLQTFNPNVLSNLFQMQQHQQHGQQPKATMLMGLLDQVGQRERRRKRKNTSTDSPGSIQMPSQMSSVGSTNNSSIIPPRPSPSPSPKSPRLPSSGKSPKRRPSESSDISEHDIKCSPRAPTPVTPNTPNTAIGILMSELGIESSSQDQSSPSTNRLDITPVESLFASKLLSNLSSAAAAAAAGHNFNDHHGHDMSELDIGFELQSSDYNQTSKFPHPNSNKVLKKGQPNFPKRSISLDSSVIMQRQSGMEGLASDLALVNPSLSITPVSTGAGSIGGGTSTSVNSLLAAMRPGIEIIPLPQPNPVNIPNSITVTPILPKANSSNSTSGSDKKSSSTSRSNQHSGDEPDGKSKKQGSKERKRKNPDDSSTPSSVKATKQRALPGNFGSASGLGNITIQNVRSLAPPQGPPPSSLQSQMKKFQNSSPSNPMSKSNNKSNNSPNTNKVGGISGGGKPSVSTLKSVSSVSPKYSDGSLNNSGNQQTKPIKMNPTKSSSSSGSGSKIIKNLGMTPVMPALKPLNESSYSASLSSQQSKSGNGSNMDNNALGKSSDSSSGSNNVSGSNQNKSHVQGSQQSSSKLGGLHSLGGNKKGLAAVIDKLKSQHSQDSGLEGMDVVKGPSGGMKKLDFTKSPSSSGQNSTISDLNKKNSSMGSSGITQGTGGIPGTGTGSEYMIKPGQGQGLKLTINKTKGHPGMSKDKLKHLNSGGGGMKTGNMSGGLKKGLTPSGMKNPMKMMQPNKKLKTDKEILSGPQSSASSKYQLVGKGIPKTSKSLENASGQLDLTKKLFTPGGVGLESGLLFDGPRFDSSSFQIPKKSRSTSQTLQPSLSSSIDTKEKNTSSSSKDKDNKPEDLSGRSSSSSSVKPIEPPILNEPSKILPPSSEDLPINLASSGPAATTTSASSTSSSSGDNNTSEADSTTEPPTLTLGATQIGTDSSDDMSLVGEKEDERPPPVLSAEVFPIPLHLQETQMLNSKPPVPEEFISPESPDPDPVAAAFPDESNPKGTPNIPTTPLNLGTSGVEDEPERSPIRSLPPIESPVQSPDEDELVMDIPSEGSASTTSSRNLTESFLGAPDSAQGSPEPKTSMPPPPPPDSPSPSPSASPVVPIVQVHIVHSPQPNSPALIARNSPFSSVVPSPHSSHPSPYTIDDELMDEALIG